MNAAAPIARTAVLGLLASALVAGCGPAGPAPEAPAAPAPKPAPSPDLPRLFVREVPVRLDGKLGTAVEIAQTDGTAGYTALRGKPFAVVVVNQLPDPAAVEWHGLRAPASQGGAAGINELPIPSGESREYHFEVDRAVTGWMAAGPGLLRQSLGAAPLVIANHEPSPPHEVVMLLQDYSFRRPEELLRQRRDAASEKPSAAATEGPGLAELEPDAVLLSPAEAARQIATGSAAMQPAAPGAEPQPGDKLLTVDAPPPPEAPAPSVDLLPLVNRRTLADPDVIRVKPGERVRLRVINAASESGYLVHTGKLEARAIAADGNPLMPLPGTEFELSPGQRLDLDFVIPEGGGTFPVLAQTEGTDTQAGLILATGDGPAPLIDPQAPEPADVFGGTQESLLRAATPLLPRDVNRQLRAVLAGPGPGYVWTINGKAFPDIEPLRVIEGERVELELVNDTAQGQPVHLGGHTFEIVAVDDAPVTGAVRDTVLVPAGRSVTVRFNADNPGVWPLGSERLYPRSGGLLTVLAYEGIPTESWQPVPSTAAPKNQEP